jgi:RHS repeat-associated protein
LQLNATATFGATGILVPGTFSYTPVLGTFPTAGNQNLSVTFTPSNPSQFNAVTASVSLTVDKATPIIQWSVPATVPLSTALSSSLLNATANVPGTFAYTPSLGTVLSGGQYTLQTTFTPQDQTDYTSASASVSIDASFLPTVGDINTIAGSGSYGLGTGSYSGDGGPGTSATLSMPNNVAVDTAGNVYIDDWSNCRIRKVSASTGYITPIAGNGCSSFTYSGEGGPATAASLGQWAIGIAVDSNDNLYISSGEYVNRILEVNATTGIITTIAGNGTGGNGGPAISAAIAPYGGIAVDKAGNIYFSELADIRKIAPNGIIEPVAGDGKGVIGAPPGDGGSALLASFDADGIALDSADNLFIADSLNNRVREVYAASGMITTIAGNGTAGYAGDGNAANSGSVKLNGPLGVSVDQNDNVYIADSGNNRIRKVSPATGNISTIAGNGTAGFAGDGGTAANAVVDYPEGVGVDASGNLYIADSENNRLRVITMPATPVITWNTPTPISYGTALSATQLNAMASVPGTFSYSPATGTVLTPGSQKLTATFTPTNTAAYSTLTATVVLIVNKSNPVVTWATPGNVPNGTTLSSTQLNATASVPGTFLYIPAAGTALTAPGVNALSVFFLPSDTADYNAVVGSTTITVDPAGVADSGTIALTVNGTVISDTAYGFEATPTSIAAGLAANVSASSPVTVTAVDDTLYLQSKQMGAAYNYPYSLQTIDYDSSDFSNPSFAYPAVSGTMDGGAVTTTSGTPTPVYSYTVGYDGVGNVTGFTDSVMGNWSLAAVPNSSGGTSNGYDTLNRLVTMHNTATTSTSNQYAGQYLCWSYDAFGNRTQQSQQSTPCPTSGASSSYSVLSYNSLNQLSGVTPPGGSSASPSPLSYDPAGNVVSDNGSGNTYLYDGEGRVCAVASSGPTGGALYTAYVYDADGTRVAKGTIQRWGTCDPLTNGFQPMTDYILGPGGQQLTEMAMDENGQMAWKHTNVWADGKLLATYDRDGLHYHLTDWLGTRRVQTDSGGAIEDACASLPYGDALTCIGPTFTTEHHFTGKERDTESGNDYFDARYYSSSMGRFISPDWSAKEDPVPYAHLDDPQTLNLYSYVQNNPLSKADLDGHGCPPDCGDPTLPTAVSTSLYDRFQDAVGALFEGTAKVLNHPAVQAYLSVLPGLSPEMGAAGEVEAGTAEAASSGGSQVSANYAQGKAFQDAVAAETAQTNTNVVQNLTLKTESGVKTVMDVVSKDGAGNTVLQEAKSSATAPLTNAQKAAHPEIAQSGATVVGKGKPGFPGGTKIPPTTVQVVRPKQQQ